MLKHKWISHSVNSRDGPGKFCGTGRLIAPWRSAAGYDGTGWSGGPSESVRLCPSRSIFFQSSKLAFLLLLFFGYRYGMEGKAWVNNYRNFAKRKTQRGKQVGEDIISQEN